MGIVLFHCILRNINIVGFFIDTVLLKYTVAIYLYQYFLMLKRFPRSGEL